MRNLACSGGIPFNTLVRANGVPPFNEKKKRLCMTCIEGRASLIKIKAGFYIKEMILIITMGRGLPGKTKRNQKNEKIQKIAVK